MYCTALFWLSFVKLPYYVVVFSANSFHHKYGVQQKIISKPQVENNFAISFFLGDEQTLSDDENKSN